MSDFERSDAPDSGRWARTLVVGLTLLIPVIAVVFAVRGEQPTEGATSAAESATTTSDAATTTAPDETTSVPSTEAPTTSEPATSEPSTTETSATQPTTTEAAAPVTTVPAGATETDAVAIDDTVLAAAAGGSSGQPIDAGVSVAMTGSIALVDGATWFEVGTAAADAQGWVEASSLAFATTTFDDRSCATLPDGPAEAPLAYRPGTATGNPDGVIAVETHTAAECHRTVLLLGSLADGTVADAFPDDLGLIDFGGMLRLDLDEPTHAPELTFADLDDDGIVIDATRSGDSSSLYIDRGPSRVDVSFLANPARIVVDSHPISDERASVGGGVVISSLTLLDAADAGDGSTIVMTGWARLPAGLGQIAFRNAPGDGRDRGTGLAVNVVFAGTSGVGQVERSWYFYRTSSDGGVWSEYRFEISGLNPGTYEIFLGLGDTIVPDGIDEPGLYHVFEVSEP